MPILHVTAYVQTDIEIIVIDQKERIAVKEKWITPSVEFCPGEFFFLQSACSATCELKAVVHMQMI